MSKQAILICYKSKFDLYKKTFDSKKELKQSSDDSDSSADYQSNRDTRNNNKSSQGVTSLIEKDIDRPALPPRPKITNMN